jgi:hypothetical protein
VTSLKDHIISKGDARRALKAGKPSTSRRPAREDSGDVQRLRSLGLDAATVALPADVDLDTRAARMNAFWEALVDLQHRDVLVVALCAGDER